MGADRLDVRQFSSCLLSQSPPPPPVLPESPVPRREFGSQIHQLLFWILDFLRCWN